MIPKTIVEILKNIFFTPKISILMKFLVLVVTKTRHPEQTLSPKVVTWNKPCHQNSSLGTNLVTKSRHPEQNASQNMSPRTNLVTKNHEVLYGPIWSCMILSSPLVSFTVLYSPFWLCIILYSLVWSFIALYSFVWS